MKKIILTLITLVLISCGASKTVRDSKKNIKGQWLLESVTYDKKESFKITLLKEASFECFEGSTWQFIPNNNTGTYSIDGEDCPTGTRHFIFTINDLDDGGQEFLLKPTDGKKKSETNQGFRLQLTQLTESTLQLQQEAKLDGEPFKINMNFSKK